jgi:diguanylate cyclase
VLLKFSRAEVDACPMSFPALLERHPAAVDRRGHPGAGVRAAYGLLGIFLLAFVASRLLRPSDSYWTWLDGWSVDGIELGGSLLCLAGAMARRRGRAAGLALGAALLSWSLGDVVMSIESLGGATPATPSWADALYLLFYPFAYIGVILFLRRGLDRVTRLSWLDGVVAGLGAATICAGFVFHRVLGLTGTTTLATLVNLAYPIGDLLLLGLAVGGTTVLGGTYRRSWILLATGCAINVVGDTANLFSRSLDGSGGSLFNAIAWPMSIFVISGSVWIRSKPSTLVAARGDARIFLPQLAAAAALAILLVATLRPLNRVTVALATATLVAAGIRLGMSSRSLRTLSEERRRQSITDELTGLANRRYLFRVLGDFFADYGSDGGTDRRLAFLFVDLDDFKEINDTFGHPSGDELLRQLGPRLATSLRSRDLLVRVGGDEFAAVLVDGDAAYAAEVAGRLTAGLKEPFCLGDLSVTVGASIGIALAPTDARDATGLMWCADVAMYRAKAARSPFAFYEHDLDAENRMRSASELRAAIEKGHLILHYQPQLDLRTGEVTGVEALVRWAHPRLGLLTPDKFLVVAQEAGLMRTITNIVLEEALSQCAAWRVAGGPLVVSVNISPTGLLDPGFSDLVRLLLKRNGLPADVLVIEITENCVIADLETSRAVIQELRDLGVVISIDDFGAGFTSLACLGSLAVGELKLDRLFVDGLVAPERARDADLVRATIDLAHTMGLRVVVEGIEDQATLDLVADFRCELVQGYFISPPRPADELFAWVGSRRRDSRRSLQS